jgi:TPR repeat protein
MKLTLKHAVAAIILVLSFALPVAAGPFEDADAAYSKGDYATALRLLRPLADQGNADAQVGLGIIFANGHGVPQDYAEAMKWLRKSADQGNANGEYYLGFSYAKGQGVTQDWVEANKWFRKSADQGNLDAQSMLGFNYANGRGVSQNVVEALKWSILAASQSLASQTIPDAGALRDAAAHNHDFLLANMSTDQIAEAQKLAREWKPTRQPPR